MSQPANAQLLVTGATGFLGRAIVSRAQSHGLTTVGTSHADVDQSDARALAKLIADIRPTYAIDAAGILPGRGDVKKNVALTKAWLDALEMLDHAPRLLLIGSAAVYGTGSARDRATREDDPMQPVSEYGRAKLEALNLARRATERNGYDIQIGIVFNLIGPHQPKQFVPQVFIRHAIEHPGQTQKVGPVETVRDFADVEDVADALIEMVQKGRKGDVVNVATGQPTRIREVLERLRHELGARWISDTALTSTQEIEVCYGDPARLMARTGWRPRYSFDEALTRAVRAAQASGAVEGRP